MLPNRIHISKYASDTLKQIRSRTGVTPNILCRMALTLSLDEGHEPNPDNIDATGLEFNLTTLFGDAVLVYESLLKQAHGNLSSKEAQQMLAGHIDNGIGKIKHAKNVSDLLIGDHLQ